MPGETRGLTAANRFSSSSASTWKSGQRRFAVMTAITSEGSVRRG